MTSLIMDKWTEVKTAYEVARLGTVSAAAEFLGVHRATVIRHIDALEAELGGTIFHRHKTGYTPTEVGEDLLRVAQATDEQFNQLAGRTRGRSKDITGDLIVTAHEHVAPLLLSALNTFQVQHPQTNVKLITSGELLKLEYGEAHVAIRSGPKPEQPDNIVQHFWDLRLALYAHESYVAKHGMPKTQSDYGKHRFVCWEAGNPAFPFRAWLAKNIPAKSKALLTANQGIAEQSVRNGMGIGFCTEPYAKQHPELVEVLATQADWVVPLWLVTHVDLHRTLKVQSFLEILKTETR